MQWSKNNDDTYSLASQSTNPEEPNTVLLLTGRIYTLNSSGVLDWSNVLCLLDDIGSYETSFGGEDLESVGMVL